MTYSQRLTHGNSSDLIYLEHQIGVTEEELAKAEEEKTHCELKLHQWRTKPTYSSEGCSSAETKMMEQLVQLQTKIDNFRIRMMNLQDDLEKLGD
ncbi:MULTISPECIES: hypothetical protein [Paenibacillus]|uniref:hypothetical protein n=1 Tax=Paenibacillus TaxID=44249 RepID=UPI001FFE9D16|nr:hypothetical protein [Paenibacillus pabuli]UPK46754.1 hypothetical protein KET34_15590 [Paenibacillus pabuli]